MDILSHGLYSGIAFGRRNRRSFWLAVFFGIAPDLFSFGVFFVERIFSLETIQIFGLGRGFPDPSTIPSYVSTLYNLTHSLVIFSLVFLIVFLIRKAPLYEMLAWLLHILMDIFSHSTEFFPTPFLWPLFDIEVNSLSWRHPYIFTPNLIILGGLCLWFFYFRRKAIAKQSENRAI